MKIRNFSGAITAIVFTLASAAVGKAAAGIQVSSSFVALGKAFRHPVKTGKALPGGMKRMFKSVKYDAQSLGSTGKAVVDEQAQGGLAGDRRGQ